MADSVSLVARYCYATFSGSASLSGNTVTYRAGVTASQGGGGDVNSFIAKAAGTTLASGSIAWGGSKSGSANIGSATCHPGQTVSTSVSCSLWSRHQQGDSGETKYGSFTISYTRAKAVITLDPGSGSGGTASVECTYGEAMPAITIPERSGYAFMGYFSGEGGAGTKYYNEDGSSAANADFDADTTLHAYWEAMSILHVADGGETKTVTNIQVVENGTVRKIIGCYSVEDGVVRQGV